MSAHPLEFFPGQFGQARPEPQRPGLHLERRKRTRVAVHWRAWLFRKNRSLAVETVTQNLSSDGFYCLAEAPFLPGERLMCALAIPTLEPTGRKEERRLECVVRVARLDCSGERAGVAFHIESYRVVVPDSNAPRMQTDSNG